MSANEITQTTSADIATGTAAKTILQLVAPNNQAVRVKGFGIGFKGVAVADTPITVELLRQTTAGTASGRNPLKRSMGGPAVQCTGQENCTAEPTSGDILWSDTVHPQGTLEIPLIGREIIMDAGTRLGLRVTAAVSVNCRAHIDAEE